MADTEIIHHCPMPGEAVTLCCGRTPHELPRTDRMTVHTELVTCPGLGDVWGQLRRQLV